MLNKKKYKKKKKGLNIPIEVKETVYERDGGCCIYCGTPGIPNSHYIKRSKMGLGIEENIVTHCINCHNALDNGNKPELTRKIKQHMKEYLQNNYEDWEEDKLIYKKYKF